MTALDDTSTWPTTQVSLSDASRRLRVLLVEAPLHAYLVSYSLHHVSTSLTMIAGSSCDRIGLFESSHTMHKPLACHFRTTTKGTRSTPPLRDHTCGVSTQSASLALTYTPGGYGGAAAATDTAHGSRDGGVGRHPPSHPSPSPRRGAFAPRHHGMEALTTQQPLGGLTSFKRWGTQLGVRCAQSGAPRASDVWFKQRSRLHAGVRTCKIKLHAPVPG